MFGKNNNNRRVFVGLSGGVDSSVTLALLSKQGYDVLGVYIKGWHPDWKECSWKEDRRDAMRVCAKLGVPFETLDMTKEYKKDVVDYFLSEYKKGKTPNPDVMCNKHIKFGGFFNWAKERGADYVATGHYARIDKGSLLRGKDMEKDQSYFLWTLKKDQLAHILFPLGEMHKSVVRKLAKKFNLPNAQKKDSQGICFLEDVTMEEFLRHYFPEEKGVVIDESGKEIGVHEGAILYTIGQRHGFHTDKNDPDEKPYFVVAKDLQENTITVSREKAVTKDNSRILLEEQNWIQVPEEGATYGGQIRYRQKPVACTLEKKDSGCWEVQFIETTQKPVSGQSLVVYNKDVCIGGGVIK